MATSFPAISGISDLSNVRFAVIQGQTICSVPGIGIPFQPVDADLTAIAALLKTDGNIIVGNGTTWVAESGNTARTSLGLGTGDTPQFTGLSVGASFSLAPIHVGNQNVENSTDSQVLVSRSITGTGTNPHSFSDSSDLNRAGAVSFNSYDARVTISGTNNYGHYAAFQTAPVFNGSGTTTHYYGYFSALTINSGTVTNNFGAYISESSGAGTIGSQYGLYVEELTKGVTRDYAVYTAGATPSHFGGTVELDRIIYSGASANILADTADGADTKSMSVWGGGAVAASRGGGFIVYGNDHASRAGDVRVLAGDAVGARIDLEGAVLGTGAATFSTTMKVGPGADAASAPDAALLVTNAGTTNVSVRNSTADVETYWGIGASAGYIGTLSNSNFSIFTNDTNRLTIGTAVITSTLPIRFPSFTVAGVPSAATAGAGAMIYVSNETGGAVPAFSDGAAWRRVTDRAVIA